MSMKMITLHDLILCDLMGEDHDIYFLYGKTYYFEGKVSKLGCIYKTMVNGNQIFHDRQPFDNVSEWADACIQNIAKEYVTRFSSWKRISHKQSGLSLFTLKQLHNHFAYGKLPVTNQTITTMRQCLTSSLVHIDKLKKHIDLLQDYINGNTSYVEPSTISEPSCLKKIQFMHNKYLLEKND